MHRRDWSLFDELLGSGLHFPSEVETGKSVDDCWRRGGGEKRRVLKPVEGQRGFEYGPVSAWKESEGNRVHSYDRVSERRIRFL